MKTTALLGFLMLFVSCHSQGRTESNLPKKEQAPMQDSSQLETATFAGGCFWCTEAIFLELDGVVAIQPGYTGGKRPNPSYEQVCSGATGHAEAVEIRFDPAKVSYEELLQIFFATHDPTTLNRQGADVGTQYRSEIFYHSPEQKLAAENYIARLTTENTFGKPIVTALSPAQTFYVAEDYHKNYYNRNKDQSYCHFVITPKVEKVRKLYKDKLKQ